MNLAMALNRDHFSFLVEFSMPSWCLLQKTTNLQSSLRDQDCVILKRGLGAEGSVVMRKGPGSGSVAGSVQRLALELENKIFILNVSI